MAQQVSQDFSGVDPMTAATDNQCRSLAKRFCAPNKDGVIDFVGQTKEYNSKLGVQEDFATRAALEATFRQIRDLEDDSVRFKHCDVNRLFQLKCNDEQGDGVKLDEYLVEHAISLRNDSGQQPAVFMDRSKVAEQLAQLRANPAAAAKPSF